MTGERFINREKELKTLLGTIDGMRRGDPAVWHSVLGARKSGKTSLLMELSRRISRDVLYARVDCWRVRSDASEFLFQLGAALLDRYLSREGYAGEIPLPGRARTPEALAECIGAARGRVRPPALEGLEMLRELVRGETMSGLFDAVADLPQSLASDLGAPVVVAIDEFQELASLPRSRRGSPSGADIYALLRSRWQSHEGVMYIVAGSRMTALRKLIFDREAPFFQHFTPLELGRFKLEDARVLLGTHLASPERSPPSAVLDAIIDSVGTLPYYLQVVGAALSGVDTPDELDVAAVRRAIDRTLLQPGGVLNLFFRNQFERVVGRSRMLARTLLALADPLPLGKLAERTGVASGAAGTYVRRLMNEDIVSRDENRRYEVTDPCFRLWLLSQEDLGGVSPPSLIGDASERQVTDALAALGFRVIYQSRASRGAFDLLGLLWGHEFAIQVKTGEPPVRLPASQIKRMQAEARQMGWIPLLATAGRDVTFFDLASVAVGRKRTLAFGTQVPPLSDILSLVVRR